MGLEGDPAELYNARVLQGCAPGSFFARPTNRWSGIAPRSRHGRPGRDAGRGPSSVPVIAVARTRSLGEACRSGPGVRLFLRLWRTADDPVHRALPLFALARRVKGLG